MTEFPRSSDLLGFTRRVLIAVAVTVITIALLLLLWYAVDVLLLAFAGVLLGIFLRGLALWLKEHSSASYGGSLALVVLLLVAVFGAGTWMLASTIVVQTEELAVRAPEALDQLESQISRYAWGRYVLEQTPPLESLLPRRSDVLTKATGIVSSTLGFVVNVLIVVFVGFYIASDPLLYEHGLERLFPKHARARAAEVLDVLGTTLWRWILGRLLLMTINGILTAIGLWAIGVPLATTLGIVTGLLNFVPNIGPILAAIPAVLIALSVSPTAVLYTVLLYILLQSIDGYVFTPIVQKYTVDMPPALTIMVQVLLGVLVGALGVLLATPLAATLLVLVKLLYVETVLGDEVEFPGVDRAA